MKLLQFRERNTLVEQENGVEMDIMKKVGLLG